MFRVRWRVRSGAAKLLNSPAFEAPGDRDHRTLGLELISAASSHLSATPGELPTVSMDYSSVNRRIPRADGVA